MSEMTPTRETKESKEREKIIITKIYQLTHPGYDTTYRTSEKGQIHFEELEKLWREKVQKISEDPNALLFYVSVFGVKEFQALQKEKRRGAAALNVFEQRRLYDKNLRNKIDEDLKRILEFKKILGPRLILLSPGKTNPRLERERLNRIMQEKGIEFARPNIPIECFGEYLEACVPHEAEYLTVILGSDREIKKNPHLSLSIHDVESKI